MDKFPCHSRLHRSGSCQLHYNGLPTKPQFSIWHSPDHHISVHLLSSSLLLLVPSASCSATGLLYCLRCSHLALPNNPFFLPLYSLAYIFIVSRPLFLSRLSAIVDTAVSHLLTCSPLETLPFGEAKDYDSHHPFVSSSTERRKSSTTSATYGCWYAFHVRSLTPAGTQHVICK